MVCVEGALRVGGRRVHLRPMLHLIQLFLSRERGPVRQVPQAATPPLHTHSLFQQGAQKAHPEQPTRRWKGRALCPAPRTGWTVVPSSQQEPGCPPVNTRQSGFSWRSNTLLEMTPDQHTPPRGSPCLQPPEDGHHPFPPHHCPLQSILHTQPE